MNAKGIFVTGTDTGVGKTIVASAIARYLRNKGVDVGVLKPVTSGGVERAGSLVSGDAELLRRASGCVSSDNDIAPYVLRQPIAPSEAARLDGVTVLYQRIRESFDRLAARHEFLIVEGAGGLLVPLAEDLLVADLARLLGLPLVIVARPDLGTVNHTLMTCECARSRGLRILGVIINCYPERPGEAERSAPRLMERLCGAPFLGVLPRIAGGDEIRIAEELASIIENSALAAVFPGG